MKVCPICKSEQENTDDICSVCGWSFAEDVTVQSNLFAEAQLADYEERYREQMDKVRRSLQVPPAEDVMIQNNLFAEMQIADYLGQFHENLVQTEPVKEIVTDEAEVAESADISKLAESIQNLSVLEQTDLMSALEEWLMAGDEDEDDA